MLYVKSSRVKDLEKYNFSPRYDIYTSSMLRYVLNDESNLVIKHYNNRWGIHVVEELVEHEMEVLYNIIEDGLVEVD